MDLTSSRVHAAILNRVGDLTGRLLARAILVDGEPVAGVGDVALGVGLDSDCGVVLREQVPEPLADVPVQVIFALLYGGQSEHGFDERSDDVYVRRGDLGARERVLPPHVVQFGGEAEAGLHDRVDQHPGECTGFLGTETDGDEIAPLALACGGSAVVERLRQGVAHGLTAVGTSELL